MLVLTSTSDLRLGGSGAAGCKKSLFSIHIKLFTLFVLTSKVVMYLGGIGAGSGAANNGNGSGVPYNSSEAAGCKKSLFSLHIKLFTLFALTSTQTWW